MDCNMPGSSVFPLSPRICSNSCSQVSNLILCCLFLLLPSIFPSIMVFSNESAHCTRWPKYWSFSFSTSPSNEYSGLISLKIDWFDLLAFKGMLESLLQHHNRKASIFWSLVFFMKLLSHIWLCDHMDCSLPGSSVHGIFQARILECVTISFSRRFSQPRDWT